MTNRTLYLAQVRMDAVRRKQQHFEAQMQRYSGAVDPQGKRGYTRALHALRMLQADVVREAAKIAVYAHDAVGQVRKHAFDAGGKPVPYWTHAAEVAAIVATVPHTSDMEAAAWLHDVPNDTRVTATDIRLIFGPEIASLVGWVSDVSTHGDGVRVVRKAKDHAHAALAPADAQTVRLADVISNTADIAERDPSFARKTYLREKWALIGLLTKGNATLRQRANVQVLQAARKLGAIAKVLGFDHGIAVALIERYGAVAPLALITIAADAAGGQRSDKDDETTIFTFPDRSELCIGHEDGFVVSVTELVPAAAA